MRGIAAGYDWDAGKSRNAVSAEEEGRYNATQLAKILKVNSRAVKEYLRTAEWHHTSGKFNKTPYYDEPLLIAIANGANDRELEGEGYTVEDVMSARAMLAKMRAFGKDETSKLIENANIQWIEWGGSFKQPEPHKKHAEGVQITIKGSFANIEFPDGRTMKKKIDAKGFYFWQGSEKPSELLHEEARYGPTRFSDPAFFENDGKASNSLSFSWHGKNFKCVPANATMDRSKKAVAAFKNKKIRREFGTSLARVTNNIFATRGISGMRLWQVKSSKPYGRNGPAAFSIGGNGEFGISNIDSEPDKWRKWWLTVTNKKEHPLEVVVNTILRSEAPIENPWAFARALQMRFETPEQKYARDNEAKIKSKALEEAAGF